MIFEPTTTHLRVTAMQVMESHEIHLVSGGMTSNQCEGAWQLGGVVVGGIFGGWGGAALGGLIGGIIGDRVC